MSGCATKAREIYTTPTIQYRAPDIPDAMLECPNAPVVPGKVASDPEVAAFIAKLWIAHGTCKDRLAALKKYLAETAGKVEVPA